MKTNRLPHLILLDGTTGSGKSSLLTYLRKKYTKSVLVGTKFTTRKKRSGDNNWEFQFVEQISKEYSQYAFKSVGNTYAVNQKEIVHSKLHNLSYAVSCVDRKIIKRLSCDFNTTIIYVYRAWSSADFEKLLDLRGTANQKDSKLRREETKLIASQYLKMVGFYDHVILNVGPKPNMLKQFSAILKLYGIVSDLPDDKSEIFI